MAKPCEFDEANCVYAKDQPQYLPLPVHKADDAKGTVTSCWELSPEELEKVQQTGRIYLQLLTFGNSLQPIWLGVDKPLHDAAGEALRN